MRINFSYRECSIEVPEKNLLGVFGPQRVKKEYSEEKIIEQGFSNPLGSFELEQLVKRGDRVLVLCDDSTRSTPVAKIFPFLEKKLKKAGVRSEDITILIALGTHRPMSREELESKLGRAVLKKYRIVNHQYQNVAELTEISSGGEIFKVNKLITEVEVVIGVGRIAPHRIAGYSGGAKIVLPGICGKEEIDKTHWLAAQFPAKKILGKAENPVRTQMEKVAKAAGLNFIVNVVQDVDEKIYTLVTGDPVEAYLRGVQFCKEVFTTSRLNQEADIVVVESYPADRDMWQAIKGAWTAEVAVKEGGVIILVTPCPEGVSREHSEVEKFGMRAYREIKDLIQQGKIKDIAAAAMMAMGGRAIKERAHQGYLVSQGIDEKIARRIGFIPCSSPTEALQKAFAEVGQNASVAIFKHAGELIPYL